MALGPKQMGEAILRNLKSKTGKDVNEWIALVQENHLSDKKAILSFLKNDQGLGHFQAQKVYEVFSNTDPYANAETFEDLVFPNKEVRRLYGKLKGKLLGMGNNVRVQPCRTYIPFYAAKQFVIVKAHGNALKVGVNLSTVRPGFEPGMNLGGSARINYQAIIAKESDINASFLKVIHESYLANA